MMDSRAEAATCSGTGYLEIASGRKMSAAQDCGCFDLGVSRFVTEQILAQQRCLSFALRVNPSARRGLRCFQNPMRASRQHRILLATST